MLQLEFLTNDERQRALAVDYWLIDADDEFVYPINYISETHAVSPHGMATRIQQICSAYRDEDSCVICDRHIPFSSRANYRQRRPSTTGWTWVCQQCKDEERAQALRDAEAADRQRHALVQAALDQKRLRRLDLAELSLREVIYVLCLMRIGASEDLSFISPQESWRATMSPTSDFDRSMIDLLFKQNLIAVHPGSKREAVIIEDGSFTKFYPAKVHWLLPLPVGGLSVSRFVEELEHRLKSHEWRETWVDESAELHRVIALEECVQYLRVVLEEHDFEARIGEKTLAVLRSALRTFSIGQVFSFIWRAVQSAAAFYVRESTSKAHAANIVPGSIQRSIERAIAENWSVRSYRRDFRAPQSALSHLLFNVVLELSDGGLNAVPPLDASDPVS